MMHSSKNQLADALEKTVAHCYSTWGASYHSEYYGENAAYPPVHVKILSDLIVAHGGKHILDAGCGPASFPRYLAGKGLTLYGFDITPEMLDEGQRVMSELEPSANLWLGSVREQQGFFKKGSSPDAYDAIVCTGVMPHIPDEDDQTVLSNIASALRPGGLALIEARNALFALFTQNRYTCEFFRDELIRESHLLAEAGETAQTLKQGLSDFYGLMRLDLPPVRAGKAEEPGYDEVLSRTHNPLTFPQMMKKVGFKDVQLNFYHYHCLPPMLRDKEPEFFKGQSIKMEDPGDWRGYFMASAFIVSGIKI